MILLIDNYDSFTYNLYQALSLLQEDVCVARNDKISIEEIRAMNPTGIVLSPGPKGPEEAGICIEVIQQLGSDIPILGVCLGHQAIGKAFGGEIKRAGEVLHGKESLIFHYKTPLFQGVSLPFKAGRYHSLLVFAESLPSCLSVDAEDPSGHIMALSHKEHPIYGVQFHPESILTPEGHKILKNFLTLCSLHAKKHKEVVSCSLN
jgi:anthranilate synthase/aminodeoxychorismate synthase-like glutamine amidotransferase